MCLPQKQPFTDVLQNGLKGLQIYEKETPVQVFSNKICEILKNNFFIEDLCLVTASVTETDQKETKRYSKKRYSMNIFVET